MPYANYDPSENLMFVDCKLIRQPQRRTYTIRTTLDKFNVDDPKLAGMVRCGFPSSDCIELYGKVTGPNKPKTEGPKWNMKIHKNHGNTLVGQRIYICTDKYYNEIETFDSLLQAIEYNKRHHLNNIFVEDRNEWLTS